jgi:hypothetical protein
MCTNVYPLLNDDVMAFLATNRLVINAEYISPVSSGPIDNAAVHGITQPAAQAFSLVFNVSTPIESACLGLSPIFALEVQCSPDTTRRTH